MIINPILLPLWHFAYKSTWPSGSSDPRHLCIYLVHGLKKLACRIRDALNSHHLAAWLSSATV
jgi:hypothetical protein